MSDVRDRIRRRVRADPGTHFNELVRELDLAVGQTQHHVRRLLRSGELVAERVYGRTHYYPRAFDPWERRALAVLRRETSRDVVCYLSRHGPTAPADVAAGVGVVRSTVEWHVSHLEERDLVEKRYDGRNRVTLHLVEPRRTADLLVRATTADRSVERFGGLRDRLRETAGASG